MGLLDSVIGSVLGGGASSPMGSVLGQLLGGGQPAAQSGGLGGLLGSLAGGNTAANTGGGGLGGLLGQLRQAGLGSQVDSWVGNTPNQPVSPQELHNVFGEQQVNAMADQAGLPPHDFLAQLSQHLPNAVNAMTPGGQLPDEGTASV